jgi:predicted ATPase
MLTRLKINGFKNLINVDVSLGPFTCIAGANGVGKSNLFDAIMFLSALADRPLIDAARCIRDEENRSTELTSLFFHAGGALQDEMSFEAEMLVSSDGTDDLGQRAKATITFLRYNLVLGYRQGDAQRPEQLVVKREELKHINVSDAHKMLGFQHAPAWRRSVVQGARRGAPFISTTLRDKSAEDEAGTSRIVLLHQDGGAGRPREHLAETLPRTVLSNTNAIESPTALLARREMQSWRLLQLEPSSLRNSDSFNSPSHLGADGSHLAATLHRLARTHTSNGSPDKAAIYARVANRLSELVEDVSDVAVDEDHRRELLTLQVRDRSQTWHAARALSDGTLRFLALAILELDPSAQGLLCFEEPENGIHPERIPAMVRLLKDLSVDPEEESGPDNPLRQVIVNTHSPSVVSLVDEDDLLVAEPREIAVAGKRHRGVGFAWLHDTWRCRLRPDERTLSLGQLRAYLNPLAFESPSPTKRRRVKDRDDARQMYFEYYQTSE